MNVPLILKSAGDFFFLWVEHIMGHFEGFFEGPETFLTPKLSWAYQRTINWGQKGQGPLEKSQEMSHYVFCHSQRKIIYCTFRIWGALVFLCPKDRERVRESKKERGERDRKRERERERESEQELEGERKLDRERAWVWERAREREQEHGKRKGQDKGKGKKERERTKARAIIFLNRLGQSKKSAYYTVL
jgi:hypothetical protein